MLHPTMSSARIDVPVLGSSCNSVESGETCLFAYIIFRAAHLGYLVFISFLDTRLQGRCFTHTHTPVQGQEVRAVKADLGTESSILYFKNVHHLTQCLLLE